MENGDHQPPMCGQAFISKVLGSPQKKIKDLQSSRRTLFLRRSGTNSSGYDDIVSLEQQLDTESESSRESNDRHDYLLPVANTTLPNLVQFDPAELEVIKREKEKSISLSNKHRQPRVRSPFLGIPLPTVTEELSFDSEEKSVAQPAQSSLELSQLPILSTLSNSSSSLASSLSFFGKLESTGSVDEDESAAPLASLQRNEEQSENTSPLIDSQVHPMSTREKMELLTAMREIILKQQEAVKEISHHNKVLKQQLRSCHSDMKVLKRSNEDQTSRINRLQLQKTAIESESTWLKDEVLSLRSELEAVKADDDLTKRFELLLEDEPVSNSYESLSLGEDHISDKESSGLKAERSQADGSNGTMPPGPDGVDQITDGNGWNNFVRSFERLDALTIPEVPTVLPPNQHDSELTLFMKEFDSALVASTGSSFDSAKTADVLAGSIVEQSGTSFDIIGRQNGEVDAFKTRLDRIQKQRMLRKSPSDRRPPVVRFA